MIKINKDKMEENKETTKTKTYDYEEVVEKTKEYFNGDELAAGVWVDKYALQDKEGNLLEQSPDDMHWRLAREFARIDNKYDDPLSKQDYYDLLKNFKYIVPQGSPMAGIGNNHQIVSIGNCFVIGNDNNADSYGAIMKSDEEQIQLMKRRAGVGQDLSHIRPADSIVRNSAMTSTGIVPFMERYSNSTREVAQFGRRGALLLSINVSHPEAENFIDAKMEGGKVTGANISVKITDEFMKIVKRTTEEDIKRFYEVSTKLFGVDKSNIQYKLLEILDNDMNPESDEVVTEFENLWSKIVYMQHFEYNDGSVYQKPVIAKNIWDKIISNATESAEPGVLYWDRITEESLAENYPGFNNLSTNPCGELPLPKGDSCRLSVLNVYSYVDAPFTNEAEFNWDLFKKHARIHQRVMDNIVDLELEKIDQILDKIKSDPETDEIKYRERQLWKKIREKCELGRRTGSGVTADGDMLAAMGYKYGTPEATEFLEKVHKVYAIESLRSSIELAEQRGAFPIFDLSYERGNPFIERIRKEDPELIDKMEKIGRRNIALMTIAPTGSVSTLTQTTSGIECAFLLSYRRKRKINPSNTNYSVDHVDEVGDSWHFYNVFHHKFIDWFYVNQFNLRYPSDEVQTHNVKDKWTIDECKSYLKELDKEKIDKLIEKSPWYGATSNDVDWVEKVKMQGAVQKWVDHSISVTTNLPKGTSVNVVNDVYMTAWESGCKGCTIYVDGSRLGVLDSGEDNDKDDINEYFKENHAPRRPKRLDCDVINFINKGDKWIAFIGLLEDKPYEIFTGPQEQFKIPSSVETGEIVRTKNDDDESEYNFYYEDKNGESVSGGNLKVSFNPQFSDISRMTSALLRHGMPIFYVVELLDSLNLDGDIVTTWKSGVKRLLKRYVQENDIKGVTCNNCGSDNVAMIEGCMSCKECGSSKCG